jgi:hypothetical protein
LPLSQPESSKSRSRQFDGGSCVPLKCRQLEICHALLGWGYRPWQRGRLKRRPTTRRSQRCEGVGGAVSLRANNGGAEAIPGIPLRVHIRSPRRMVWIDFPHPAFRDDHRLLGGRGNHQVCGEVGLDLNRSIIRLRRAAHDGANFLPARKIIPDPAVHNVRRRRERF